MNKKAFTLIETLIGITMIGIVITAVTGLILNTILSNERNKHLLQANMLAQEGLEVMRHIRDSNWLQNYSWNGGQDEWGSDFILGADEEEMEIYLTQSGCTHQWCFSASPEEINQFTREIFIDRVPDNEDMVQVTALVTWRDKGVTREYKLSTYLTNWQ